MGRLRLYLHTWYVVAASAAAIVIAASAAEPGTAHFVTFAEAQEARTAFGRTEDAAGWDAWVRKEDREVRARIDRGVEDSISNLILYGTSFTGLARVPAETAASADLAGGATGELTDAARRRVRAAMEALSGSTVNERMQFARDFLRRRGVAPGGTEAFLETNLVRFAREQRGYQEKLKALREAGDANEARFVGATLFDQRGLSVDTSLLPNYALEDSLRALQRKGVLAAGSIRSIAVIGPGLDFTDKRDGYDFYPVQTIQPFAVMEAALRLGLAKAGDLKLVTLDLNPAVNAHLRGMANRARAGAAYEVQLPRDEAADWTPQAIAYWERFGERIGSPAAAVAAPKGVRVRAVAVDPKYALMIEPLDLNVVAQVMDGNAFDLVIATNILVYYDRFQQALAMGGIARMMNKGGVFLSNTVLPAQRPEALEYLGRRSVTYSASGSYGDDVVVYRRR